jgi:Zn-dependent membrane protease YugP
MALVGSGKATQVPEETVKSLPVTLVPETVGSVITVGIAVICIVDIVYLVTVPTEFETVTAAKRYLPSAAC